ncbi:MAG: hypothetical protein AAGH65_07120 [Pseudomonadota bacterium]
MDQLFWTLVMGGYVLSVVFATRWTYGWMTRRGVEPVRAIYYNRKIIHMVGAGVSTLFVPLVFTDLWFPMLGGIALGAFLFYTHASGQRLYWFQMEDNQNDVSFAVMWWLTLAFLWWLLGDPWLAILPALFMAFGDGITGVIRNGLVRHRSKHPIGNVFMVLVSVPLAWVIGSQADPALPVWSVLAALASSVVERYEFGPIDDNILIGVTATVLLWIGSILGPITF